MLYHLETYHDRRWTPREVYSSEDLACWILEQRLRTGARWRLQVRPSRPEFNEQHNQTTQQHEDHTSSSI